MRLLHAFVFASTLGVSQEAYEVPEGAYLLPKVPPNYREWHRAAQECAESLGAGRMRPFEEIEWWGVPGDFFGLYGGDGFAGYYDSRPRPKRIYIVESWGLDMSLIRHEALHHALEPEIGHPAPPFGFCEYP